MRITKPTQALACQYPFIIAYKSGVMLDKVTKACYNFLALFVFAVFNAPFVC
ncbi:hypothetical protein HPHPH9_0208 [Helicobacter pylori Hp H-9]|nr:hypothetical protein HPHPH9_0208 [Helicobacter pylori Hp H-9]